jgi:hypothetical protein
VTAFWSSPIPSLLHLKVLGTIKSFPGGIGPAFVAESEIHTFIASGILSGLFSSALHEFFSQMRAAGLKNCVLCDKVF